MKPLTTSEFIEKARVVHGFDYDYSLTEYTTAKQPVKIICKTHGVFNQTPDAHIHKCGCPMCSGRHKTTEFVISKFIEVHGNKYDYSFVDYINSTKKINIACKIHGLFSQSPADHLSSRGCPVCADVARADAKRMGKDEFVRQARKVHGNKYFYRHVKYRNNGIKVKIVCPDHGNFEQTPAKHLFGRGCPGCATFGFDRTKPGYLYLLRSECGYYVKIGITDNPKRREYELSRTTPFKFNRVELLKDQGSKIAKMEKHLLSLSEPVQFPYPFDGSTEWRLWSKELHEKFLSVANHELEAVV